MAPMAPKTPISFNAYYDQLPSIMQAFVRYYLKPLIFNSAYRSAFFSGLLAVGVFAGLYISAPGGDTESFFLLFSVPAPVSGEGLAFAVAAGAAALARYAYLRRNRMTVMAG